MAHFVFVPDSADKCLLSGRLRVLLAAFIVMLVSPTFLHSQALTGYVSGRVFDSSGKLITGASVALINPSTGQKRMTLTSQTGDFVFPQVLPGIFDLQVKSP